MSVDGFDVDDEGNQTGQEVGGVLISQDLEYSILQKLAEQKIFLATYSTSSDNGVEYRGGEQNLEVIFLGEIHESNSSLVLIRDYLRGINMEEDPAKDVGPIIILVENDFFFRGR